MGWDQIGWNKYKEIIALTDPILEVRFSAILNSVVYAKVHPI